MLSAYELRELRDSDEDSLLETFRLAFGRERDAASWRWAYRRNPAGTRAMVATCGDEVVAQYAALPSRVWMDGETQVFAQVVDSMVHPAHRAGLKRPGLFVRTAEAFFERFGGTPDALYFGWPVQENLRIGARLLGYERAGAQLVLARPVGDAAADDEVVELDTFDHRARWVYERCAAGWGAATVRDEDWLNWRYVERPGAAYVRLAAPAGPGAFAGVCVGCRAELSQRPVAVIADWLVPPEEYRAGEALLASFEARARAAGAEALVVSVPPWSPWFAWFQGEGFILRPSAWDLVVRSFARGVDLSLVREGWWVQLGEMDLV